MVFSMILQKLVSLYLLIAMGYVAGRFLAVKKETVAILLFYLVVPVVAFYGVLTTQLDASMVSLPLFFFLFCSGMTLVAYYVYGKFFGSPAKNILAVIAGSGNTGYFGVPLVTMLLGENMLGPVVFALVGYIFYESSVGFYIAARGRYGLRDAVMKVLKLPVFYAAALGVILNLAGVESSDTITQLGMNFRGAYVVLGMMMVGLAASSGFKLGFDFKFIGVTFSTKFLVWPLVILGVIKLDMVFFNFYDPTLHKMLIIMSVVPLAANSTALATIFNSEPEKTATSVLLSTVIALFLIPLVASLFVF
jgi:predicted permease